MTTKRIMFALILIGSCLALATPAGASDRWLHVLVDERDEQVRVNVPLSMIGSVLPLIESQDVWDGHVQFGDDDLDDLDWRAMLDALRDAPDADYVTVKGRHESVRVAKEREQLIVFVEDRGSRSERIEVRVPMRVVEALIASDPYELDFAAALDALADSDEDLVSVVSDEGTIRVWIDSDSAGR